MKLDQLKVPTLKPRDPNQAVLASKRNAGGAMRDKKHEWKRGEMKHRGRAYEELLESLEDNQAELAGEFDTMIAKAKRDGWKAERISQWKIQFDKLNQAFASAYYSDNEDEDEAIEGVLDSMEELLDELADELGELREGVEPRKLSGKRGTIEKRLRDAKLAKQREAEAEDYDDDEDDKKPVKEERAKWHDSDAPDANGKFRDLGVNDLADWLIKTRGGDARKIYGSINQQIVFNRKNNPTHAKKMESVREAVKRKLAAKKD